MYMETKNLNELPIIKAVANFENSINELCVEMDKIDFHTNKQNEELITEFLNVVSTSENWLFEKVGYSVVKSLFYPPCDIPTRNNGNE